MTKREDRDVRDDRRERKLPVTAEVGSEGGSFADPTMQVATFAEDRDIPRTPGEGGVSSVATQATRSDTVAGGGLSAAPDPAADVVRYPTDPPPRSTPAGSGIAWSAGLIGAAAGAAVAIVLLTFWRQRAD